jgi:phosphoenolpyruvate-protein phosphotransferase
MKIIRGIPVSPGFAEGIACVHLEHTDPDVPSLAINRDELPAEIARFDRSVAASLRELRALRDRMLSEIGQSEAGILDAHLALLDDPQFIKRVKKRLADELVNVEKAIATEIQSMERLLLAVENEYLRERRHDIRDIGRRLLRHLKQDGAEQRNQLSKLPENTILIARELLPSDTLDLDRAHVVGIVVEQGGSQSHTAILARALGIPLVTGVEQATTRIKAGHRLLLDGETGTVTIAPSSSQRSHHRKVDNEYRQRLREHSGIPDCRTRDGCRITLRGNVGRLGELSDIRQQHLDGIGLFRSEYLFLNSARPPRLDRQAHVYSRILSQLEGLPAVVRTLDLGGDKHPAFLTQTKTDNPGMDLRGLRFSLAHPQLFRTQLRGLLRASSAGRLRILFPMVSTVDDLLAGIKELHNAAGLEDIDSLPEVGAMIETPAALLMIEDILEEVDFVSIGTNDLIQFMLAADRDSLEMFSQTNPLHPALFRAIDRISTAARAKGKPCSVCGEAAGDPLLAALFAGLGIRELSVSPIRAPEIRHAMSTHSLGRLETTAKTLLTCRTRSEISELVTPLSTAMHQPELPTY